MKKHQKLLTKFAFFVTLPPYVFLNIVKSSNTNIFQWDFIIRFEIVTILIITFSFFFSKFCSNIIIEKLHFSL